MAWLLSRRFSGLVFVLLFLGSSVAAGAATPDSVALRRTAMLQRGVNLSGWFATTSDFSQQHAETYITPSDLRLIHDSGMSFVRLGIDPAPLLQHGLKSTETANAMSRINLAVNEILQAGLAVELCVFPEEDYKQRLETQKGVDDFILLWRFLAQTYANRDPEHIFLELMNEPGMNDAYRWMGVEAVVINAIRKVDSTHTIVATAARYSGLDDLLRLQPFQDDNTIYNFHFYEPHPFTHQGAEWGSTEWSYFNNVPYPATAETLSSVLASIPDDSARYQLFLYGIAGWNQQSILARLQFARDWANEHHVPIICDEFGAYRDKAPADSRARYVHDVRTAFERLQIGWAMWDYRGDFGMVRREGAVSVPDAAIFDALGLRKPR